MFNNGEEKGIGQQMTRASAKQPVDAVRQALERALSKRGKSIKPIELVKTAFSAYLSATFHVEQSLGESPEEESENRPTHKIESSDAASLRRGTQAAVDRMLFNANYWRAAYEQRIIDACEHADVALECLQSISVWNSHALKLNTLSLDETIAIFERFCPPFAYNNRRGTKDSARAGKGPLPDFKRTIQLLRKEQRINEQEFAALNALLSEMEAEATLYENLGQSGSLSALFTILPAWCLQSRIELVNETWWDDYYVMKEIIDTLEKHFADLGSSLSSCEYFHDSCYEALDAYHRDLTSDSSPLNELDIPHLVSLIQEARESHPNFETDGYENILPLWLISKEQLIWNIIVCSLYGPETARPLLVDSPELLSQQGYTEKSDVITELAQTSFMRYTADRIASQADQEFATFASLPSDLRDSSIAYISSIHRKLDTLGYEVLPVGSCYPERRINCFTESEVECLAILEHRRWLNEREKAGWRYGSIKNVSLRKSPYMVPWEELPDRAKEWNRSAVRSIPNLLASVNLAVVK